MPEPTVLMHLMPRRLLRMGRKPPLRTRARQPLVRGRRAKQLETCRDRFANALNFRGFPNIPGQDAVLRYAAKGDANQGVVL